MLTKTFLIAWYGAMYTRLSQCLPKTKIVKCISPKWEQTPTITQDQHEYTYDTATYARAGSKYISACLMHHNEPVAGIITTGKETWGIIQNEWMERPSVSFAPPEIIETSVHEDLYLDGYKIKKLEDATEAAIDVLRGDALAFIQMKRPVYTQDICAIDIMAKSLNASFVEWATAKPFNYTSNIHTHGLYLSTTQHRIWFGIASKLRSTSMQIVILFIAWFGLYLYPDDSLVKRQVQVRKGIGFLKCTITIIISMLARNAIQDHIWATEFQGEKFQSNNVLIFFLKLTTTLYASIWVKQRSTPIFQISLASIATISASIALFTAQQHVSYPVTSIFKSLQMISTVLVGRYVFKKKKTSYIDWLSISLAGSVVICLLAKYEPPSDALTPFTSTILTLFLAFVAVGCHWQQYLYDKYNPPAIEMMCMINYCSALFIGLLVLFSGELTEALEFSMEHWSIIPLFGLLIIPTIIEQWTIQLVLRDYGANIYAMILTASEAFALVGHSIANNQRLKPQIYFGIAMLSGTLKLIHINSFNARVQAYKPVSQKDPEKGYDSMEEYELESGDDEHID